MYELYRDYAAMCCTTIIGVEKELRVCRLLAFSVCVRVYLRKQGIDLNRVLENSVICIKKKNSAMYKHVQTSVI